MPQQITASSVKTCRTSQANKNRHRFVIFLLAIFALHVKQQQNLQIECDRKEYADTSLKW